MYSFVSYDNYKFSEHISIIVKCILHKTHSYILIFLWLYKYNEKKFIFASDCHHQTLLVHYLSSEVSRIRNSNIY